MKTTLLFVLLELNPQFYWGVAASAVVAVLALFAFFVIFRPRIKVVPIVAYQQKGDVEKNGRKCEVALVNKGLFACNDIKVRIEIVGRNQNESEKPKLLKEVDFLSISGRLHNENSSVRVVDFKLDDAGIPETIKVSVLAKHSVSGVEYGRERLLMVTDFKRGTFEKGTFVPYGNTYKQSIMRKNTKLFKNLVPILFVLSSITVIVLSLLLSLPLGMILMIVALALILITTILVVWQFYVHSKTDAYSSLMAYHVIERVVDKTLIAIIQQKDKDSLIKALTNDAEDVEEVKENN